MFENTLGAVEDLGLTYLHVFPYSPRPGTPAARMPQVPAAKRKARAARLRAAGEAALRRFLEHVLAHDDVWICRRADIARTYHGAG